MPAVVAARPASDKDEGAMGPPVQIENIQNLSEGDQEFQRKVIEAYLADMEGLMDAIEDAAEARNGQALKEKAHEIKGTSANFGAWGAQQAAGRLERIGEVENLESARDGVESLKKELARVKRFFLEYLASLEQ